MEISGSVLSSGLSAVQAGQRRANQAATEIAGAAVSPPPEAQSTRSSDSNADLATGLVELQAGKIQVQAGAKVIETADEVLGTLIDTRA